MQIPEVSPGVQDSLLAICLFAAFADGAQSDDEREAIRQLATELGSENVAALSRQILMRKLPLESAVAGLTTREDRLLAYEMALGLCEVCGSASPEEKAFLSSLRAQLGLNKGDSRTVETEVATLALSPAIIPPPPAVTASEPPPLPAAPDNSGMILNHAILNGALELLPETLATMAIIPLQMNMVYRIGQSHGVELDRAHIKEFLAAAGVGLGSQMVEGFARKLMKGLGKKMAGKLAGQAASQVTGSAFSFASTYAIGHVAEKYYSEGRKLDARNFKALFDSFQTKAREMHQKYLPQIQEKAGTLNPGSILSLVTKGGAI